MTALCAPVPSPVRCRACGGALPDDAVAAWYAIGWRHGVSAVFERLHAGVVGHDAREYEPECEPEWCPAEADASGEGWPAA